MEATASILFSRLRTCLPKLPHSLKHTPRLHFSNSTFTLHSHFYPSHFTSFRLHSTAQPGVVLETPDITQEKSIKRKVFVYNIPWTYSSDDLKKVFSECGTVKDAEVIRDKDGKYRGFAFVTMSSGEEAQAVLDKFNLKELSGRTIKVEFAKKLKKPRPQPESSTDLPANETRFKLYISNLQWKARSSHLREFFSVDFNPVSCRVVFENPAGRSAGYGFVSFNTKEEAEAAISALNGKEILGRPVTLKFSERVKPGETSNEDGEEKEENKIDSVSIISEEETDVSVRAVSKEEKDDSVTAVSEQDKDDSVTAVSEEEKDDSVTAVSEEEISETEQKS